MAALVAENNALRRGGGPHGGPLNQTAFSIPPAAVSMAAVVRAPASAAMLTKSDAVPMDDAQQQNLAQREASLAVQRLEMEQCRFQQQAHHTVLARYQAQLNNQQADLDSRQAILAWQEASIGSRAQELGARAEALQQLEQNLNGRVEADRVAWQSLQQQQQASTVEHEAARAELAELLHAPPESGLADLVSRGRTLACASNMMRLDPALTAACLVFRGRQPNLRMSELWFAARNDASLRQQWLAEAFADEGLVPTPDHRPAAAAPDATSQNLGTQDSKDL